MASYIIELTLSNEPMYKAIAIIHDLVKKGHVVWDGEVSKKFIDRFYSK